MNNAAFIFKKFHNKLETSYLSFSAEAPGALVEEDSKTADMDKALFNPNADGTDEREVNPVATLAKANSANARMQCIFSLLLFVTESRERKRNKAMADDDEDSCNVIRKKTILFKTFGSVATENIIGSAAVERQFFCRE